MPKINQPEDVFNYIDTKDGNQHVCWPWTGNLGGRSLDRGYFSVKGIKWLSYRLVWTIVNGPIPPGMVIRHKCDNPMCCNPFHMELGTQSDNEKDKYLRDRAGMPVTVVREIKRLLNVTGLNNAAIARDVSLRFGMEVSRKYVSNIANGIRRSDIDEAKTAEEIFAERTQHVLGVDDEEEQAEPEDQGEAEQDGASDGQDQGSRFVCSEVTEEVR